METKEVSKKKILQGFVVNNARNKTIVVKVVRKNIHPQYRKPVILTVRFKAHDEKNECTAGDEVRIIECRPLSKDKHFRLLEIVKKADVRDVKVELEAAVEKAMKVEKKIPPKQEAPVATADPANPPANS
ncbi:MAG: 30S ribosomal protein S17 [Spirochaetes bacterium]|nr:30S ribosomal protein S17 [Spirochaetota bacterium]